MSDSCTQGCEGCSGCEQSQPQSLIEKPHELSSIKKVIGVISGKGGVGKSFVTGALAVLLNRRGYKTAIIDADLTGPSIPKMFGLREKATSNELGVFPVKTKSGIPVMSINLLLEDDTDPVVWRGPIIAGTVKQFWTDVIYSDVDFMFVDMPPGTGDVPLTVFQSIPVDGIVIVTTPQELVSMIVQKALKMAVMMDVPVLGLVENLSYIRCPDCGREIRPFGDGNLEETAQRYQLPVLAKIPISGDIAKAADSGLIELFEGDFLDRAADAVENTAK